MENLPRHFDEGTDLTNETDEEVQSGEQEMEDSATEEEDTNWDEWHQEAFQWPLDYPFGRNLDKSSSDIGGAIYSQSRRGVIYTPGRICWIRSNRNRPPPSAMVIRRY
jgi:hypothetical protein